MNKCALDGNEFICKKTVIIRINLLQRFCGILVNQILRINESFATR